MKLPPLLPLLVLPPPLLLGAAGVAAVIFAVELAMASDAVAALPPLAAAPRPAAVRALQSAPAAPPPAVGLHMRRVWVAMISRAPPRPDIYITLDRSKPNCFANCFATTHLPQHTMSTKLPTHPAEEAAAAAAAAAPAHHPPPHHPKGVLGKIKETLGLGAHAEEEQPGTPDVGQPEAAAATSKVQCAQHLPRTCPPSPRWEACRPA